MGENKANMADLAALRQMSYSLLSAVFLGNWRDTADLISDTASDVLAVSNWAADMSFYPALSEFLEEFSKLGSESHAEVENRYQRLFGPTPSANSVPLNETSYLVPGAEETGWVLASVERHYSSAGIESTSASGNVTDHIAVELEFIAFLCGRETDAWAGDDFKEARRMQDRQRRFLDQHLTKWIPIFLREVIARDDTGPFEQAAKAVHVQVIHDLDFLRSLQPLMRSAV
ncbi:MAG: molecular chaperone TorD family protein [Chloroflexi bacterium]|jgi:TorA maturation chaperone TorD|nr:molecular chaperone TorD family protein [Chloroflexota bacterium]MBT5627275.1 molecular chaperone TorD family protein [Chloroflexota bacterium]